MFLFLGYVYSVFGDPETRVIASLTERRSTPMSADKVDIEALWANAHKTTHAFGEKYRLVGNGRLVPRDSHLEWPGRAATDPVMGDGSKK